MGKDEILEIFKKVAADPYAYARERGKATGRRVAGIYPADFPEELVHAAGFLPLALVGSGHGHGESGSLIQPFADSHARAILDDVLGGRLDFLDAIFITHVDDTTRVLASMIRRNGDIPYFDDFLTPKRFDTPHSCPFMTAEIRRLAEGISNHTGAGIDPRAMAASIRLYNRDRDLLRQVNAARQRSPRLLSDAAFFSIVRASMAMPREEHVRLLEEFLPHLHAAGPGELPSSPVPVVVSGFGCEPLKIFDLLSRAGGRCVADDLVCGSRYFEKDAPEDDDPVAAMAARLLDQPPSPFFISTTPRDAYLADLVERSRAKGVVFFQMKFNESFNYDYPNLKNFLEARGIPTLLVETDMHMTGEGQMLTRLEAFFEMIAGI